jgi:putative transposase
VSSSNQVPDPEVPARARSRTYSRAFCQRFFRWYNTEHRHSGIAWHTPESVHYGQSEAIRTARADVLTAAYTRNPERFVRKHPEPAALHPAVWINKPTDQPRRQMTQ